MVEEGLEPFSPGDHFLKKPVPRWAHPGLLEFGRGALLREEFLKDTAAAALNCFCYKIS